MLPNLIMPDSFEQKCSGCGQTLRIPKDIGGLVLVCPTCGKKFYSDFKIKGERKRCTVKDLPSTLFELPLSLFEKIVNFFK